MTLALDLGWRDVSCTVIEQGDGAVGQPKIGHIAMRTMEFYRRWGIDRRVRECGFPPEFSLSKVVCTSLAAEPLFVEELASIRDMPKPDYTTETKQRCPQHWLVPILQKSVAEYTSVDVRYGWKLERFEQFDDHVDAHVRIAASGEAVIIRAKYLVACDGFGSTIRQSLGIAMHGKPTLSYSIGVMVQSKDLLRYCHYGPAERYFFVGPEGTWGNWTVIDGQGLWRLTVLGSTQKLDLETFDARAWVRRAIGRDDAPFEIVSLLPWKRSEVTAERFSDRRVFLVGDSAHSMSPTGGMGMNTGACEAVDIGWKLEAMVKGWGGATLMDSYDAERRPIAVRNAASSTENFKAITSAGDCGAILDDTPEGADVRRRVGDGLRAAMKARYWEPSGLQLGYRYEGSPICIPDGTPPTPDEQAQYIQTARPGHRAPHAWMDDGRSTLDLFGRGFALLRFPGSHDVDVDALTHAAAARHVPLTVTAVDTPEIAALYAAPLVLVRPDGHVAWRGQTVVDAVRIIDTVRGE